MCGWVLTHGFCCRHYIKKAVSIAATKALATPLSAQFLLPSFVRK